MSNNSVVIPALELNFAQRRNVFSVAFVLLSVFFISFPEVDLALSNYFYQENAFPLSRHPHWLLLRDYHRISQWYWLGSMLFLIAIYAVWSRPLRAIAPHKILYIILTYALSAGVVVQCFKVIFGRARPKELVEFGGLLDFSHAWQLAGVCQHSCSFPSGEASAAAAMLPLLVLVPGHFRGLTAIFLVPVLLLISLNRVFMGAHFISDVLIAWGLVIGVMFWLWPTIARNAEAIDQGVREMGSRWRRWAIKYRAYRK